MRTITTAAALLVTVLAMSSATAQSSQTTTTTPARPAASTAAPATTPSQSLIDVNSAPSDQLQTLTGIGPARAEAIVKGRPYKGKDELHRKNIIPESVYEGIKDKIIARQS
jgi:DNA uptake protein ComE-like DNA-binding protein